MEFFNSKKFIIVIVLVLFFTALSGCAKTVMETQGPKQPTTLETVGKMKSIGVVIGCMFAPHTCDEAKESKDEEK